MHCNKTIWNRRQRILKVVRKNFLIHGKPQKTQICHQRPCSPGEKGVTYSKCRRNCQPRILHPELFFINEGRIKTFPNKQFRALIDHGSDRMVLFKIYFWPMENIGECQKWLPCLYLERLHGDGAITQDGMTMKE